jgi:hypothetical protein
MEINVVIDKGVREIIDKFLFETINDELKKEMEGR